jgi:hypothetical protein
MVVVLPEYRLTRKRRREVCVHEAAHAVIHALGGSFVYLVAVAPNDATSWEVHDRKGVLNTGLWGLCSISDFCTWYIQWNEEHCEYAVDRKGYAKYLRDMERQVNDFHASEGRGRTRIAAEQRRIVRAHICGAMAGPAADAIHQGQDVADALEWWSVDFCERDEDLCVADAMARLLPFRNEYDHAVQVTEAALRRPDIWTKVQALADELERAGSLENEQIDPFLPEADSHWPPSPRRRIVRAMP